MPDNAEIEQHRPPKHPVDPSIPYRFLHEREPDPAGQIREVNTIFLTNRECPFRCLMCDLWKHTLDEPTPPGAIPRQIEYALDRLPEASVAKLYNNGNFFDKKAIPEEDLPAIARRLRDYDRVIVENHPKLCGPDCAAFSDSLAGDLEIAIGLETVHPEVLPLLNKQITADNFKRAAGYLTERDIAVRTFILLNPPYLTGQEENIEWTMRSVEFAFEKGSDCCSVIPTRPGNGIMEKLRNEGHYVPPTLDAIEEVFERALRMAGKGRRVFADTWDLERFSSCTECFSERKRRLDRMNLEQRMLPAVKCAVCGKE